MDKKLKVVLVDDEDDFCFFVKANLESTGGLEVTTTGSGREGIELVLKHKPDVVILDLRKFSIGCEFFVIVSGGSDPHVKALAEWVEDELIRECGARPWHREGLGQARWVLLDYVTVVIHVFDQEARDYYRLERLWGDAPQETVPIAPRGAQAAAADAEPAGDGE